MFSRREKIMLAVAALAVAAAVGVQLSSSASRTPGLNGGEIAGWQALRQRVDDASARLRAVTAPEPEVIGHLLRAAQASGAATGVIVTSARPRRATRTSSGCMEHTLEIQVAGRFPSIARFVFDLEAKHADIRIARVAVNSSESGSDKVDCGITIAGYSPGEVAK